MNRNFFFTLVTSFIVLTFCSQAQLAQYAIGSTGNEIASKVIFLPSQQATIIAGYTYDYSGADASNCQAIVMKVYHGGIIAWQKTFGKPGKNNLIQDMIITQDGNIVVVGSINRNTVYDGNTAAILKFNSGDGSLMWQTCLRATPTSVAGEIFLGVTEMHDGSGRIVTVGGTNFVPASVNAMVCVFESNGTLIYNDIIGLGGTDYFYGVTSSLSGGNVYICGVSQGDYADGQVMSYTPGTSSGTINWVKYYDFALNGNLQNNFFNSIYLSGSKLLLTGNSMHNYSTSGGLGQFVMTVDAADGGSPQLRGIQNNGTLFSNNPVIAVDSFDHIYTAQSPSTAFYDAMLWVSGVSTNTVVTEITSLSSKTANRPVRFKSEAIGLHSFLDMKYQDGYLFLAGSTNVPTGFGNNDIYYVISAPTLSSLNHNCDTSQETVTITDTTITVSSNTPSLSHILVTYDSVTVSNSSLSIREICGDSDIVTNIANTVLPDFRIFPNPVNNELKIETPFTIHSIEISNLYGQQVFCGNFNSKNINLALSNLKAGMYIVNINNIYKKTFYKMQ